VIRTRLRVRESGSSAIVESQGWGTRRPPYASGGSVRSTARRGATASLTFHGRAVAWLAPVAPGRGRARVSIDGRRAGVVDLSAARVMRRIVFASRALERGEHTIRIERLSGRIDLDALVVLD
jgi:hypothetical protein